MRFVKMHGLGNDFVIVSYEYVSHLDISHIASEIANRKTGIGCDQFLVYKNLDQNKYQLWIYNIDGSLTGACGNAMRCMTKLVYMEFGIKHVEFEVLGRKIECKVLADDRFEANMGKVSFEEQWMPEQLRICKALPSSIPVNSLICADIGNKHLVLFLNKITDAESWKLGEVMERSFYDGEFLFPEGVNVNIALLAGENINLNVWERQVGFTGACGSGACATVASAIKLGYIKDKATVHFSSGMLDIYMKDEEMYMSGPATFVASGEVVMESLRSCVAAVAISLKRCAT